MKSTILLLISLALLGYSSADEEWKPKTSEEIREIQTECLKNNALAEALMKIWEYPEALMKIWEYQPIEAVRYYILCAAAKLKIFSVHQGYYAERMAKQFKMDLEEAEVLTIAQGCIDNNEQKDSVDVWAFRGLKCMMESKVGDPIRAHIKRKHDEAVAAAAAAEKKA